MSALVCLLRMVFAHEAYYAHASRDGRRSASVRLGGARTTGASWGIDRSTFDGQRARDPRTAREIIYTSEDLNSLETPVRDYLCRIHLSDHVS